MPRQERCRNEWTRKQRIITPRCARLSWTLLMSPVTGQPAATKSLVSGWTPTFQATRTAAHHRRCFLFLLWWASAYYKRSQYTSSTTCRRHGHREDAGDAVALLLPQQKHYIIVPLVDLYRPGSQV
ncbi:uncharacterized protein LOC126438132 isoform X5 [Schistocerca serialis cubense]|uniref:uncharacterized protein LOC126438132 isoform X1 n=1 Tax=Schistocerca serialis cubense TaxID=2023355 RepID=UPI00214F30DC|nr:uncharacterized protein LOC126438132 isoform X1 [Schistocerca serialis cubense]XP_049946472.1 uncharacterized protein LOC126438132 isoform X2 [Schistocerca serialis cubense]XP_049946473.1 uncharacterized protein LOC126438132 isoform X3 [Schistocerca serialis cubense]XP_049946474.1 uncharacterized protein LOC126438132 isoform X4 [Schistocerca serialis cubense]XP_049946475.1 uncharacterized protein LOC126438132 isoform X5 [Schistocerca serialis cubense]